jgi:cytochrome P450
MRDDASTAYAPEDFSADIIEQRILWSRIFVINQPEGIRHILLDNAANYRKSEVGRRVLEPALGRGLLTSEGDTWRRHRRIMAPAFDPRGIAGYATIMAEVTQTLLAEWDAFAEPREADVAAAMMHTTLHIISGAMFSSDSDEIVDVVEADVNLYQSKVRPTLADFLHLPRWLARLIAPFPTSGIFDEFDIKVDKLLTERGRAPNARPESSVQEKRSEPRTQRFNVASGQR